MACVASAYKFRISIWGLITTVVILSVSAEPADAKRRHSKPAKQTAKVARYSPPYSAIVVDANSGKVLHDDHADGIRHPASLTKIMTLYLLFERLESGKLSLSSELDVSSHASSMAPSKLGLRPGQTIRVDDAIRALVTKSANDVAVVVAEGIAGDEGKFAQMMTRKARALGMNRTVYRNASGLPNSDQVTTARDQAVLGRAIQDQYPKYYRYFATSQFSYRGRAMRNHNRLLGRVNGVDGIKTGYTVASGFNLVSSVKRGNRYIIAVVLGGRSAGSRDAQMRTLIDTHIASGATIRTAPMVAELGSTRSPEAERPQVVAARMSAGTMAKAAPSRPPAPIQVASSAAPVPPLMRADDTPTAAIPATVGSSDDIQPIPVRTVKVKASTLHAAAIGSQQPLHTASSAPEPKATPVPKRVPVPIVVEKIEHVDIASADASVPVMRSRPAQPRTAAHAGWIVQVGALDSVGAANQRIADAQSKAKDALGGADAFTEPVAKGDKTLYRARFAVLDKAKAEAACRELKRAEIVCITLKN
jgi:D-alanyl-D-alanine carboxypeptidase